MYSIQITINGVTYVNYISS